MSTVLSNGVKIPDTGSTNWDVDVNNNFSLLNTAIGDIQGKVNSSDLSTVATTGSYNDLADKPTIPDTSNLVTKSELADVATSGSYEDLSNKPTNTVTTDTEQTISGAKDFTTIPTIDGDNTLCGADVLTLEEIEASTSFNDTDVASASTVKPEIYNQNGLLAIKINHCVFISTSNGYFDCSTNTIPVGYIPTSNIFVPCYVENGETSSYALLSTSGTVSYGDNGDKGKILFSAIYRCN